ncbi:MAG: hypothetical protein GEV00_13215 [Actinophytocola sp.]|nr:hypothetical protein [Actinophytocola sp.]
MIEPADDDRDRKLPDDPQTRPTEAVDALEEHVFGEKTNQRRKEDDTDESVFEHDIDTHDHANPDAGPDEPPE